MRPSPQPLNVPIIIITIQDSRCYLMNGGAVESFFISEDTPVGSIIGTLSVNGDPGDEGDISLRVQERKPAVALVPGSKNVTLTRALDREEKTGPSSVYVNVRCDRRHTTDPSFVIPVSVRVWDVNDNAPSWSGAPYRARVSELAAVGTRLLTARAHDPDQPGPHATVRYSVLPGPAAEYVGFPSELDGALVVRKPLDYETATNLTVTLRAQDGGSPPRHNDTTLTIVVMDADDQNPTFTHDHYSAVIPEDAREGTILETFPGPVAAHDQDRGINAPVTYSVRASPSPADNNTALVRLHKDSGELSVTGDLLRASLPTTIVIQATQVDNPDRYALATLSVSRAGSGSVSFPRRLYSVSVREDSAPGSVLLSLEARGQGPLQYFVSDRSFLQQFAISEAGELLLRRALDRLVRHYDYQVMVTDGRTNDTAHINISVEAVNEWEPRFKHAQYSFVVERPTGEGRVRVGRLHVHDGDPEDRVSVKVAGPDAAAVTVDDAGDVFVSAPALRNMRSDTLHLVATAVDSGTPPRQGALLVGCNACLSASRPCRCRSACLPPPPRLPPAPPPPVQCGHVRVCVCVVAGTAGRAAALPSQAQTLFGQKPPT
ncbi:Cad96Cb isoform C [Danaus plexippus plexippus]|uniref:Cad96Cb isoform C n=1 Tax=Danaus plexippus plexippus TaxID=278856 RepID=A0A212FKE2_DANPL|nr:Cad96Cb isoform C [Danaus plexippus plexippus]